MEIILPIVFHVEPCVYEIYFDETDLVLTSDISFESPTDRPEGIIGAGIEALTKMTSMREFISLIPG